MWWKGKLGGGGGRGGGGGGTGSASGSRSGAAALTAGAVAVQIVHIPGILVFVLSCWTLAAALATALAAALDKISQLFDLTWYSINYSLLDVRKIHLHV